MKSTIATRCQREGRQFESGLVLHTKRSRRAQRGGIFFARSFELVLLWSLALKSMPTERGAESDKRAASRNGWPREAWTEVSRQFESGLVLHLSPRIFSSIRDVRGFSVVRSA